MSVFRVEKNKGYTVMSNHHLRNHTLSLKAKGLLSQMLSLSDDWDYTLQGLAQINKESIDAIREAVRELERAGYIERSRERDERGCLRGTVYTIYEQPHTEPTSEEPAQALPTLDNPTLEKPMLDLPTLENPTQLNTESTKKRKRQSKDLSITDSIPFPSGFPESPTQKRTEAKESKEQFIGEINRINSQVRGIIQYHQCCTWVSVALRRHSHRLQMIAKMCIKQYGGRWIPANQTQNLLHVHQKHQQKIPSIKYRDIYVGFICPSDSSPVTTASVGA